MNQVTSSSLAVAFIKMALLRPDVKLGPHQLQLVERSRKIPGGQIANWRTGGGKTPGSIAVAEDRGGETLVITPAALRSNYQDSIRRFTTDDRHGKYHVMSFEQFSKDPEGHVARFKPNTVILDEVHRVRNPGKARKSIELVRSKIPYMIGNTASLVNNRPEELVPIVNLVAGKTIYEGPTDFAKQHLGTKKVRAPGLLGLLGIRKGSAVEVIKNKSALKKNLSPYVHRFSGDSKFQSNFPDVVDEVKYVEPTAKQKKIMDGIMKANPDLAYKIKMNLPPSKSELKSMNAFSVAMRQASNNPAEFDTTISDSVAESPKFQAMIKDQLEMSKADKNFRSVIYSNFLSSGVKPVTNRLSDKGVATGVFSGGLTDRMRKKMVDDYNSGKIKTLGISPAGGEGLDLKGTKLIQMTEDHWNPERRRQVSGRGARFKSHSHLPVDERKLVVRDYVLRNKPSLWHKIPGTAGPESTIDQWIRARRQEKQDLNDSFVNAIG